MGTPYWLYVQYTVTNRLLNQYIIAASALVPICGANWRHSLARPRPLSAKSGRCHPSRIRDPRPDLATAVFIESVSRNTNLLPMGLAAPNSVWHVACYPLSSFDRELDLAWAEQR